MFLQIDVYEKDSLTPSATQYATLLNRTTETDPIWSLGRKQGDFLVKDDRSVSRIHLAVEIVSANKTHNLDGPHSPRTCSTPEQIQACKSSSDQMCVVVQNQSKLGSFAIRDASSKQSHQATTTNNGIDSDTADEEEVMQTQSQTALSADISLSAISQQLVPNSNIKSILSNETHVLHELSASEDDEQDTPKRAVVQVGKLGTTVVLTRHHIRLTPSTQTKKQLAVLPDLYTIGATISSPVTKGPFHYYVADQLNPSHSQLTAWSLGVPMVNMNFVQALLDRTSATDPLPQIDDNNAPKPDGRAFWKMPANVQLWQSCTLLSHHPHGHDIESLIAAAGAKLLPLYNHHTKKWLSDSQVAEIVQTTDHPFAIQDSKKKVIKVLKKHHVPLFSQKEVATAICEQRWLVDGDGNPVGTKVEENEEEEEEEKPAVDETPVASTAKGETANHKRKAPRKEASDETSPPFKKQRPETSSKADDSSPEEKEPALDIETAKTRAKRGRKLAKSVDESPNDTEQSSSKPSKKAKTSPKSDGKEEKDKGRRGRTAGAVSETAEYDDTPMEDDTAGNQKLPQKSLPTKPTRTSLQSFKNP